MKNDWPSLAFAQLEDTVATVQLWTQIVGKIRLRQMPWINHSWHVTLYITPRGITTGSIPYSLGIFEIEFDFIVHELRISTSTGAQQKMALYSRTVASFYKELMQHLQDLDIQILIHGAPNELPEAIPFEQDEIHKTYEADQMHALWRAWVNIHNVFTLFRSYFSGKCSPVHLFWGAFDLAVTRFSGRRAPLHPGGAPHMPLEVMQEAYSHEVSSCGFWPGSQAFPFPAFYAYCYPTPPDFGQQAVQPAAAFWSEEMGEFFLKYEDVATAANPENILLQFLHSTYNAAAITGNWDRQALEADLSRFNKL